MRYVSTGSKLIDQLTGGFLCGAVNLVYGDPGTGKTTLVLQTILANIESQNSKQRFLVIDTEGGVSRQRLLSMAVSRQIPPSVVKDRVVIYRPQDLGEQQRILVAKLPSDIQVRGWQPALIAIDSLVTHYHKQVLRAPPAFMAVRAKELQGRLAIQLATLLRLAQQYDIPILVTSWTRSRVGHVIRSEAPSPFHDPAASFHAFDYDVIGGRHLVYTAKLVLRTLKLPPPLNQTGTACSKQKERKGESRSSEGKKPVKQRQRQTLPQIVQPLYALLLEKHIEQPTDRIAFLYLTEQGFVASGLPILTVAEAFRLYK